MERDFSSGLTLVHLGLHLPTGNGSFAVIAGFELQCDGAWADVGYRHVGWRAGELCEEAEREEKLNKEREGTNN